MCQYRKYLVISSWRKMRCRISFYNICILEKNKFSPLLNVNLLPFFKCKYFFLPLAYFRPEDPFSCQIYWCILFNRLVWLKIQYCLEYLLYSGVFPLFFWIRFVLSSHHQFLFARHKWIILVGNFLQQNFLKNFILRGHFFFLVKPFLQLSLYSFY